MNRNRVIVAGFDGDLGPAERVAVRLADAWAQPPVPAFSVVCGASLGMEDVEPIDALVVVPELDADEAAMLTLLAMLEEASVPVLAVLEAPPPPGNNYEFAGAMVRCRSDEDALLAAALQGLVHRQRDVRRLRHEVSLAHRFHGGLKGQISKIHEELQLAAMVQREFLPRELPELHGVSFAAIWRPQNYVSGDIYDVTRLDEDHVAVFVADAIGHGVPAALMTMVISRSLVTKEITRGSYRLVPPEEVLERLNEAMIRRQGTTTRFATAVYALVDCRRRVMTYAGAGHPPPILLKANGSTVELRAGGGLLGVFEGEKYPQIDVPLDVGDQLMMYSDGFEQAFPGSEPGRHRVPTDRYLDEFQALRNQPDPDAMIQELAVRLDDQSGSLHQADDVTFVCMMAGPLAGKAAAPCPAGSSATSRSAEAS